MYSLILKEPNKENFYIKRVNVKVASRGEIGDEIIFFENKVYQKQAVKAFDKETVNHSTTEKNIALTDPTIKTNQINIHQKAVMVRQVKQKDFETNMIQQRKQHKEKVEIYATEETTNSQRAQIAMLDEAKALHKLYER